MFDNLQRASRNLSNASLVVPKAGAEEKHRNRLAELSDRVERLEQALAAKSDEFRKQQRQQGRTPEDIRRALPPRVALVDFLDYKRYGPLQTKAEKPVREQRLVAFVVRSGAPVARVELGPTAAVAGLIDAWRKDFGGAKDAGNANPGEALRHLVWDRLESQLGGDKTVLISPDGDDGPIPVGRAARQETGLVFDRRHGHRVVPIPRLLPELLADDQAGGAVVRNGATSKSRRCCWSAT